MKNDNKKILDEMLEQNLLKINQRGFMISISSILFVIILQIILTMSLKIVAGELAVFFILCIYKISANAKNGIWGNSAVPSLKKNAVISLVPALILFVAEIIIVSIRLDKFSSKVIVPFLCLVIFVYIASLISLQVMGKICSKNRNELDSDKFNDE